MTSTTAAAAFSGPGSDLKIVNIEAFPTSYPLPQNGGVTLGIGRAIKRDAVVIKVTTAGGLIGYGESHHGRSHTAIATLVNTTLRQLVLGMDASDVVGVWAKIYKMQLGSHGMGAAASMAMSGIDLALWDIRGKAVGWPLWKLLGGARKPIPAYAGGVALGYQEPASLVEEARALVEKGYKAVKLRIGDSVKRDMEGVAAVREDYGDELVI
ncbi:MAG: mandelate racemase/muconate lactonizing enzyme family protein, partial [Burkholderiales bacterium]